MIHGEKTPLDVWAEKNKKYFETFDPSMGQISAKNEPENQIWKKTDVTSENYIPGLEFFRTQPFCLTIQKPLTFAAHALPRTELYNFRERPEGSIFKDINIIRNQAPPLTIILDDLQPNAPDTYREDFDKSITTYVSKTRFTTFRFSGINVMQSSQKIKIFEPIIITAFLYDYLIKARVSESWRFLANAEEASEIVDSRSLLTAPILSSPLEATFQIPFDLKTNHPPNAVFFVVSLERLFVHNGGSSITKYYMKPNPISELAAKSDIKNASQSFTTSTFAFNYQDVLELESKKNELTFDFFIPTDTVCDQFLNSQFMNSSQGLKLKKNSLPISVKFNLDHVRTDYQMHSYFPFPPLTPMEFVNEIVISIKQAFFKLPSGMHKARNIIFELRLMDENKPLEIIPGEYAYTSRCRYHVNNPTFHDELTIKLPLTMKSNALLDFRFYHCSVKSKASKSREFFASVQFPLFPSGAVLANGEHKAPFTYLIDNVPQVSEDSAHHDHDQTNSNAQNSGDSNEENVLIIQSKLRSCVYASDKTIQALLNGNFESIPPAFTKKEQKESLQSLLFFVLDTVITQINEANYSAFQALMSILKTFNGDRGNPPQNLLAFYIRYCALRKESERALFLQLIPLWQRYMRETQFNTERPDFVSCWFLLELIVKSLYCAQKVKAEVLHLVVDLIKTLSSSSIPCSRSLQNPYQCTGAIVNLYVALFARDLLEFANKDVFCQIVSTHLQYIDTSKCIFDRVCFRRFFSAISTPKSFSIILAKPRPDEPSLFESAFLPHFIGGIFVKDHTNALFTSLFKLLFRYSDKEQEFIAPLLMPLVLALGKCLPTLNKYNSPQNLIHLLSIIHFVIYFTKIESLDENLASILHFLIDKGRHLQSSKYQEKFENATQDLESNDQNSNTNENLKSRSLPEESRPATEALTPSSNANNQKGVYRKTLMELSQLLKPFTKQNVFDQLDTDVVDETVCRHYDGLAFAIQAHMIFLIKQFTSNIENKKVKDDTFLYILNDIICPLFSVPIAPLLEDHLLSVTNLFISSQRIQQLLFSSSNSSLDLRSNLSPHTKTLIHKIFKNITPQRFQIVLKIRDIERELTRKELTSKNYYLNGKCFDPNKADPKTFTIKTDSWICKSLSNNHPTEKTVEVVCGNNNPRNKDIANLVKSLYEICKALDDPQNKSNIDYYADLICQMGDLLSQSPDARLNTLQQLSKYHFEKGLFAESYVDKLTAAALVAEYLTILKRIPPVYQNLNQKQLEHASDAFAEVCPSAFSEHAPDYVMVKPPYCLGYCTSDEFTEYGILQLVQDAMDACKRAMLFELLPKLHKLIGPLAERRHQWNVISATFTKGAIACRIVGNFQKTTDLNRNLGLYYRVQFESVKEFFIFRENSYSNIWDVMPKIAKSADHLAKLCGKTEVIGVNQGENLEDKSISKDPSKYYVHVKAVQPYFTPEEMLSRVTPFERNYNVQKFYFEIPIYESNEHTLQNTSLRRTIFILDHPLPYIVRRVKVPQDDQHVNIRTYTPIEKCILDLTEMIAKIDSAIAKKDYSGLQTLIQGSLLTQVNDGPKKMAEVFLSGMEENEKSAKNRDALRALFREFIRASSEGVRVHGEYAAINPVWANLQEHLEPALNELTTTLQTYIK